VPRPPKIPLAPNAARNPGFGTPSFTVPVTGLESRPSRFTSDEESFMAKRRSSRRTGGGKGTTISKAFTPAFTLKGGYGGKKRTNGKSRY